jgi:general secretion pathway protein G
MAHYTETGRRDRSRGFTLVELAIVTIIISILAVIAIPLYQNSVLRAKETTLKTNLFHMRDAIDQYTADKKIAPQTLDDLVDGGYFRAVPMDPITGQNTTWQVRIDVSPVAANSSETGIVDVHSGSIDLSPTDGTPYNTW